MIDLSGNVLERTFVYLYHSDSLDFIVLLFFNYIKDPKIYRYAFYGKFILTLKHL